jgi:hypothetical protein
MTSGGLAAFFKDVVHMGLASRVWRRLEGGVVTEGARLDNAAEM